jgi:glycosyltransferase involved in cell wall biosynthesis
MLHVLLIPSQRFVAEDNPVGGIFQLDLSLALQRSGLRVGIVAPMPRSLRGWRLSELGRRRTWTSSDDQGVVIVRPDHYAWVPSRTPYLSRAYQVSLGKRLFERYIEQYGMPDLVHAHNVLFAGAVAFNLKKNYGLPYVLTEHSSAYITHTIKRWQESTVRDVLRNADHRFVVSNYLASAMEEKYGAFMQPWERMPNIVSTEFTTARLGASNADERRPGFRFLNIAAMLPWKNQSNLLRAFATSFKDRNDVHLGIGGDGPLRSELECLSQDLGIRDRVEFMGVLSREQVVEQFQASDAYVLSSDFETFGVVLIEAMAMGRPVIATDCGGPKEIVDDQNGMLVPVDDVTALADAMSRMVERARQYSQKDLRDRCIAEYGEGVIVGRHVAIYKSLI